MALLSDKQSFDNLAGIRAQAAIDSFNATQEGKTWSLLDACQAARLDPPVSEADLKKVFKVLDFWQIHHNLYGEPIWVELMKA